MIFRISLSLLSAFLIFVSPNSFAGGTVSFAEDIIPLLRNRQALINPILHGLNINDTGESSRIGRVICPGLAGARIPPYVFHAREYGANGSELQLIINSNVDFYDRNGKIVFHIEDGIPNESDGDLALAVTLRETFSSIMIKVRKPVTNL